MEDAKSIIYDFIGQYTDFVETDKESGYANVYRPSWHISPLQRTCKGEVNIKQRIFIILI